MSTGQRRRRASPARFWMAACVVMAALTAVALVVLLDLSMYPAWVLALSGALFAIYGFDKRRAQVGGARVPESVLHLAALAGGFPGGWAGRLVFRHKTRKPSFLLVLILATLLHLGVVLMII